MDNTAIIALSLIAAIVMIIIPLCFKPKNPAKYSRKFSRKGKIVWYSFSVIGMFQHYAIATYICDITQIEDSFLRFIANVSRYICGIGVIMLGLGTILLITSSVSQHDDNDSLFEPKSNAFKNNFID